MKFTESLNNNLRTFLFFEDNNSDRIGELEIFIDENGKQWLNQIYLDLDYRHNGGASKMFQFVMNKCGEILISIADKGSHKRNGISSDTRYIEPPDGVRFVNNLYKHKVISKSAFQNPFPLEQLHWAAEYFPFLNANI